VWLEVTKLTIGVVDMFHKAIHLPAKKEEKGIIDHLGTFRKGNEVLAKGKMGSVPVHTPVLGVGHVNRRSYKTLLRVLSSRSVSLSVRLESDSEFMTVDTKANSVGEGRGGIV
jgi:hypothetical protein